MQTLDAFPSITNQSSNSSNYQFVYSTWCQIFNKYKCLIFIYLLFTTFNLKICFVEVSYVYVKYIHVSIFMLRYRKLLVTVNIIISYRFTISWDFYCIVSKIYPSDIFRFNTRNPVFSLVLAIFSFFFLLHLFGIPRGSSRKQMFVGNFCQAKIYITFHCILLVSILCEKTNNFEFISFHSTSVIFFSLWPLFLELRSVLYLN